MRWKDSTNDQTTGIRPKTAIRMAAGLTMAHPVSASCRRPRERFDRLFAGHRKPVARIETSSLPTLRVLLAQSDRLTLLTSYELMCEEDTLTSVPYVGPIEPVPSFGLTMRENWLPTQRQASFIQLIQKRIVRSLMPAHESRRSRPDRPLVASL